MRIFRLSMAFVLLAAPALAQGSEAAMCEYSHPQHPGWDFFRPCQVTVETRPGAVVTRAEVANGSSFTIEEVQLADGASRVSVNDRPAALIVREDAQCLRTEGEGETICIHPAGTEAPVAASAEESDLDLAVAAQGIGGGEAGFCLLTTVAGGTRQLIDHGACSRAENCQVSESSGTTTCLTIYVWKNGRENGLYRDGDWLALDGSAVTEDEDGCVTDDESGQGFCFAREDWTEEGQPVLAGPVAVEMQETAEPAAAPVASATPAAPPTGALTGLCRFLKDGTEIAAQPCSGEASCSGPACAYSFALEDGISVSLGTTAGEIRAIDGAPAGPVPVRAGVPLCVPYTGSPFIFCFVPG